MRKKREEKFITIKDVAKEAGVSIATVSRVINNGVVREQKKKAVLDAIKKLDYVPNNSARNLAAVNATKRIMLLVPTIALPCYIELIKGFKTGAKVYKYDPIIQEYEFDANTYQRINNELLASSEIKAVVQIGKPMDIANKIVVNLNDSLLDVNLNERYNEQSVGVYFPKDEILSQYIIEETFKNGKASNISKDIDKSLDTYLTQTIEQACELVNEGITQPIFTLEATNELSKIIKNIDTFPIDFYAIGVVLSNIAIKKITGTAENATPLELEIK